MTRADGPAGSGRARRLLLAAVSWRLPDESTFLRGLSIGALVGAAIAGSTIWQRRSHRRPAGPPGSAAATAGDPPSPEVRGS